MYIYAQVVSLQVLILITFLYLLSSWYICEVLFRLVKALVLIEIAYPLLTLNLITFLFSLSFSFSFTYFTAAAASGRSPLFPFMMSTYSKGGSNNSSNPVLNNSADMDTISKLKAESFRDGSVVIHKLSKSFASTTAGEILVHVAPHRVH